MLPLSFAYSSFNKAIPIWLKEKLFLKNVIKEKLQEFENNFSESKKKFAEHHVSHAAGAFYRPI